MRPAIFTPSQGRHPGQTDQQDHRARGSRGGWPPPIDTEYGEDALRHRRGGAALASRPHPLDCCAIPIAATHEQPEGVDTGLSIEGYGQLIVSIETLPAAWPHDPTVDGEGVRMSARRRLRENRAVFEITNGPSEVNAWSEVRLPLQPKGDMLEFRQQLAAAIRAMPPSTDGQLVAAYTAADPHALIDTENVLFYNVGLGCFAAHTRMGLAFERVFAAPPNPPTLAVGPRATIIATA